MAQVRVYRPGSEVFSDEILRSAAHRPVTNDRACQFQELESLCSRTNGRRITGEGIFIRVPLMVSNESAIIDIEAGKQELSAGYTCDLDFTAGTQARPATPSRRTSVSTMLRLCSTAGSENRFALKTVRKHGALPRSL